MQRLTGSPRPYDLVEVTTKILGEHLRAQAGPACELTGGELIRRRLLLASTDVITMALYAAVAPHDERRCPAPGGEPTVQRRRLRLRPRRLRQPHPLNGQGGATQAGPRCPLAPHLPYH
ncbi:hypothetical protein [Micromonospora sp. NPDC002717]|uniref:hypothetical protein n=1 Tax=Micromonospora sp. NPDC002717 TaxID=3154424 RepID=UPI0033200700